MNFSRHLLPMLCALLGAGAGAYWASPRTVAETGGGKAEMPGARAAEKSADPLARVIAEATAARNLQDLARLIPQLSRLDSAQMHELLSRVAKAPEVLRLDVVSALFGWWAVRDYEAATAWLRPQLDLWKRMRRFGDPPEFWSLLEAWVTANPPRALEFAREVADQPLAEPMLYNLSRSWPNPGEFLKILRGFPARARGDVLYAHVMNWARADFESALAGVHRLPEFEERDTLLAGMLAIRARQNGLDAVKRAKAFGLLKAPQLGPVLREAGLRDFSGIAGWVREQGEGLHPDAVRIFGYDWAAKDPVAAFGWVQGLGLLHERPGFAVMLSGAHARPGETRAWLAGQPAGLERDRLVASTLREVQNLDAATPFLGLLPEEDAALEAFHLAKRFPSAEAQAWAAGLPAGPMREQAWAGFAAAVPPVRDEFWRTSETLLKAAPTPADRDAVLAQLATAVVIDTKNLSNERPLDFALQISNPELRRQTFNDAMTEATEAAGSRGPARDWLKNWVNLAQVPEDWKAPWRAKLKDQ